MVSEKLWPACEEEKKLFISTGLFVQQSQTAGFPTVELLAVYLHLETRLKYLFAYSGLAMHLVVLIRLLNILG